GRQPGAIARSSTAVADAPSGDASRQTAARRAHAAGAAAVRAWLLHIQRHIAYGICFTNPSHSGDTKGTHWGLRRKRTSTKDIVDHEQRSSEHWGIGLDVEPPSCPTRLHIVAGQLYNPVRPQTQTRAAYRIHREHGHRISMRLLRINIR